MYTIYINVYAKIFSVIMSGLMSESESRLCIDELRSKVNNITPSEYALIIDMKDLCIAPHNFMSLMQEVKEIAFITPFKTQYSFEPIQA